MSVTGGAVIGATICCVSLELRERVEGKLLRGQNSVFERYIFVLELVFFFFDTSWIRHLPVPSSHCISPSFLWSYNISLS
jgi:hypothetical protein